MTVVPLPDPKAVFINVPFDSSYEPLFITLIGSLVFLGQEPHCVLEVREKGDGRLVRIVDLMSKCRMSIHDLSRTGTPVRFNMPFELGLACSLKVANPDKYEIFVLDSRPYRMDRTLSDYKGRDPLIYGGTCDGIVTCLVDTFAANVPPDITQLLSATRALRKSVRLWKRQIHASSLFRPLTFRLIAATATDIAKERGFITP